MSPRRRPGRGKGPWRRVDEEVTEGLLLLEYTVRMRLRNRITVDTLTSGGDVDVERWAEDARIAVRALWRQADESADRMGLALRAGARIPGRARDEHDYRTSDTGNLRRRRKAYRLIAGRLRRWEADPVRIAELISSARDEAATEIEREIARVARTDAVAAEDELLLRARLALIVRVDLPALERDVHRPRKDDGAG